MNNHVIFSGCSGGGKSTLLQEIGGRGFRIVEEPGRRIVAKELADGGSSLPWIDPEAFARCAIDVSLQDIALIKDLCEWVFFDRGLIDAITALEFYTGELHNHDLDRQHKFHTKVFLTPPWPEIYQRDSERQHDMNEAIQEYERLLLSYPKRGYELNILPKVSVIERANFVMEELGLG